MSSWKRVLKGIDYTLMGAAAKRKDMEDMCCMMIKVAVYRAKDDGMVMKQLRTMRRRPTL